MAFVDVKAPALLVGKESLDAISPSIKAAGLISVLDVLSG
jgi:hypothetical protein